MIGLETEGWKETSKYCSGLDNLPSGWMDKGWKVVEIVGIEGDVRTAMMDIRRILLKRDRRHLFLLF